MKNQITFVLFLALIIPFLGEAQVAFPGAVGPGANATGGRENELEREVFAVTDTSDSISSPAEGSFLDAVSQGNRIIVFHTGGRVNLRGPLNISVNNLTILFDTAPGGGFCVSGDHLAFGGSNYIIRGGRFRPGDAVGGNHSEPSDRDGLFMGGADNWIIDHCSVSWGIDVGGISIWSPSFPGAEDFTVQYSIGEALHDNTHAKGPHSDAMNINRADNGLVHNCLLVHCNARFPQYDGDMASHIEFRNLVIYNWKNAAMEIEESGTVWATNLLFIDGLDDIGRKEIRIREDDPPLGIYLKHIIGPNRTSDTGDNWAVVNGSNEYQLLAEPFAGSALREHYVLDDMQGHILHNAGAIIPKRDRVDSTWVEDVLNGTGKIKDAVALGTVYWPFGEVVSAERVGDVDSIRFYSPAGGSKTADNVYLNDTIVISYDRPYEVLDDSLKILGSDNQETLTVVVTDNFDTLPETGDLFRIRNSYTDATRVTVGYPNYDLGTAPTDSDGDLIPDWVEEIIGSDPEEEDAFDDADGDGYANVEEWSHLFYSWQPPKLIRR